ncbi:anti-CBASS protein Acb1 family protein [Levilactobacillus sp. 244-2]|uniref:anti-CBASS protein Acb1 family protein n=1 Tax=Levilactobacillus sp. 244-2 TaxID=2799569 RepID=UPI0019508A1D|nr:anti-CBASS Acb1 family protein [Levilactobacillus sp. 244-2]
MSKDIVGLDGNPLIMDFMQTKQAPTAGTRHPDPFRMQRPGMGHHLGYYELEQLYRGNSMARNIVDIPAEDMTRNGWHIKMDDNSLAAKYEARLNELNAQKRFKDLYRYSRLYRAGYIAISTTESWNYGLEDPLNPDRLLRIPFLTAFSSKKVNETKFDDDVFSPTYGQALSYQINNGTADVQGSNYYGVQQVDKSRLLRQQELRFEDETEGISLLETIYDILMTMDTGLYSVGEILYDYVFKVFKSPSVDDTSPDKLLQVGAAASSKFRTESTALISDKDELTKESTNVGGIDSLLDFLWEYLSGAARMPKSVLKGQEAGTLTGAQYDVMNYYSRIASDQENKMRPQLEYLLKLLMRASDECGGSLDPDTVNWSIEFNPLWSVDSQTDSQIRLANAQADQIYIQNGVQGPEEVREARFGSSGMDPDGSVDMDSMSDDERRAVVEAYRKEHGGD